MNIKNVKEVFDWLAKNYEDNFYYEQEKKNRGELDNITVSIYDEDEGWKSKTLYFDSQGNAIPNYEKKLEIKRQIRELQEELKKLEEI